jgi:hypothetical protein
MSFIGGWMAERGSVMRRGFSDFLLSACALLVLLGALVVSDERVRQELTLRMNGPRASADIVAAGSRAGSLATLAIRAAKDQSQQHTPLMIFVVAATVLTLFMVRT